MADAVPDWLAKVTQRPVDEPEGETTPPDEYDGIEVILSREQIALIVYCVMDVSKTQSLGKQIEWARLAIALNDLLTEEDDDRAQSG